MLSTKLEGIKRQKIDKDNLVKKQAYELLQQIIKAA